MRVIDLRLGLIRVVRGLRQEGGWDQAEAACRLEISPAEYAKIESGSHEPTLNQLIPTFFGLGGTTEGLCQLVRATDRAMERCDARSEASDRLLKTVESEKRRPLIGERKLDRGHGHSLWDCLIGGGFELTSVDNLVGWVSTQLHVLGQDPAY